LPDFPVKGFTQRRQAAKAQREKEKYTNMTENEIAKIVVDAASCIRKYFGPGLHEAVYEICLNGLPED
jgi:carbamoylphosphate synthase large subunit